MQIDIAESLAKIFSLGLERRTILIRGVDKALLDLSKALLDCGLWLTMNETIKARSYGPSPPNDRLQAREWSKIA